MKSVLIVDDDTKLRRIIEINFEAAGYRVHTAGEGLAALRAAREHQPDLVILDVMMPGLDGFSVCRMLREDPDFPDCSILMLTARDQLTDKGEGFRAGADDYLVKPFAPNELLWRSEALLRRLRRPSLKEREIACGALRFFPVTQEVLVDGARKPLSRLEALVLGCLAETPGQVVPNEVLQRRVWKEETPESLASLRVTVNRIRQGIEPRPEAPRYLRTVRGRGYMLSGG